MSFGGHYSPHDTRLPTWPSVSGLALGGRLNPGPAGPGEGLARLGDMYPVMEEEVRVGEGGPRWGLLGAVGRLPGQGRGCECHVGLALSCLLVSPDRRGI